MSQLIGPQRFYSDFYDSTFQRTYAPLCRDDEVRKARVLGRMRLDIILARKLVITDAQLLDGGFFLDQKPQELLGRLKRVATAGRLPIEVRARTPSLSNALLGLVLPLKGGKLRGVSFSSIESSGERSAAKEALEKLSVSHITSWRSIAQVLKSIGVSEENLNRMERGWAHWIEAQDEGWLEVKQWQGEFDIDQHLGLPEDFPASLETEAGRNALHYSFEKRTDRNSVDTHVTKLRAESSNDDAVRFEIDAVDAWFNRAYNATAMCQHGCTSFESVRDHQMKEFEKSQGKRLTFRDGTSAELLGSIDIEGVDVYRRLGDMPDEKFRSMFWDNNNMKNFDSWWNEGKINSLRTGFEPFADAIVGQSTSPEQKLSKDMTMTSLDILTFGLVSIGVKYVEAKTNLASPGEGLTQRVLQIAGQRIRKEADQ